MKSLTEMVILKVFFVIPLLLQCESRIRIEIDTESQSIENLTRVFGEDLKLVSDQEVALFNITKENLKRGLRVELGKEPDDVFLRDPTPYENLYEQFKWPQVKRNLKVKDIKIIHIQKEPIMLRRHEHVNNAFTPLKYKIDVVEVVEHTVNSIWSDFGMPLDESSYDVILKFDNVHYNYSNTWRNTGVHGFVMPLGYARDEYVEIYPGQEIIYELSAFKTIILLEVDYEAKLTGNVIADYDLLHGKYHFYSPTVENIMKAGNIPNALSTIELFEIRCYTGPKLKIYDKKTGKNVHTTSSMAPLKKKFKKVSLNDDTRKNNGLKRPEVVQVVWR